MSRIAELLEHPSRLFGHHEPESFVRHHPKSATGGLIVLALVVGVLIWMWPEIQRYLRIRRM